MSLFSFLTDHPVYKDRSAAVPRLTRRHQFIVEPFLADLKDAKVLDLASHDGRWSYALAHAGAKTVYGVEGRQDLIDRFDTFPKDDAHAKVTMECNDIFDALERMNYEGEEFDVVAVYGLFYHITEHYRLLTLIHALRPKVIIIDGAFVFQPIPIIQFGVEDVEKELNSIERVPGQRKTMVGAPSRRWVEVAAETLGYEHEWMPWQTLAEKDRTGVRDYFGKTRKKRATVALRPKQAD